MQKKRDLQRKCVQELEWRVVEVGGSGEWGRWGLVKGVEGEDAIDEGCCGALELGLLRFLREKMMVMMKKGRLEDKVKFVLTINTNNSIIQILSSPLQPLG